MFVAKITTQTTSVNSETPCLCEWKLPENNAGVVWNINEYQGLYHIKYVGFR